MSASWEYRGVATIVKTHGRKGEVVAQPRLGLPLLLEKGMHVAIVPPPLKGPRHFTVRSVFDSDSAQRVALEGVHNLDVASALVGRTVLVPKDELSEDFAAHDAMALIGREVVDVRLGPLGSIAEVMRGPANDVWVLEGALGEVLVPVVEQVVVELPEEGAIVCAVPDGLVEVPGR